MAKRETDADLPEAKRPAAVDDAALSAFLGRFTVGDLLHAQHQRLVALNHTDTIEHAFEVLSQHQLTGAPVRLAPAADESKSDANQETRFLGFVDLLDLMTFLCVMDDEHARSETPHVWDPAVTKKRFQLPISHVLNASARDPFEPVVSSATVAHVCRFFFQHAVHRVPVLDADSVVVGVVSQSDVVRLLHTHRTDASVKAALAQTLITSVPSVGRAVAELANNGGAAVLGARAVVSVTMEHTVGQALHAIVGKGVTGLAVIDSHGHLVNTVSAADFRGWTVSSAFKLQLTLREVLSPAKPPPVVAAPSSTLEHLCRLVVEHKVHRVFVVAGEHDVQKAWSAAERASADAPDFELVAPTAPLAVASLTDIIRGVVGMAGIL